MPPTEPIPTLGRIVIACIATASGQLVRRPAIVIRNFGVPGPNSAVWANVFTHDAGLEGDGLPPIISKHLTYDQSGIVVGTWHWPPRS